MCILKKCTHTHIHYDWVNRSDIRKSESRGEREWERFPSDCPQSYVDDMGAWVRFERDFPSWFNFGFCQNLLTRTTFPTRNDVKLANTQHNVHTIWYHTMIIFYSSVYLLCVAQLCSASRMSLFSRLFSAFRFGWLNANRFKKRYIHWQRANETPKRAFFAYRKKKKSLGKYDQWNGCNGPKMMDRMVLKLIWCVHIWSLWNALQHGSNIQVDIWNRIFFSFFILFYRDNILKSQKIEITTVKCVRAKKKQRKVKVLSPLKMWLTPSSCIIRIEN